MIVKSSTTIRTDYDMISSLAHEVEEPIYITQNGEVDLVVMSIEAFEKRDQLSRLRSKLMFAEHSRLTGGPNVSLGEANEKLDEKYNGEAR